jgi:hypothetical protein
MAGESLTLEALIVAVAQMRAHQKASARDSEARRAALVASRAAEKRVDEMLTGASRIGSADCRGERAHPDQDAARGGTTPCPLRSHPRRMVGADSQSRPLKGPSMRVYIAAPYAYAGQVRALHTMLRHQGMTPTSSWADAAGDHETLDEMDEKEAWAIAARNDQDLLSSDVVLVLLAPQAGETIAELRHALVVGIPVLVVLMGGREVLSVRRPGVERFSVLDHALARLRGMLVCWQEKYDAYRARIAGESSQ